jgi:3-methyl-2-oxobutanoate hydroxymethyltransferase
MESAGAAALLLEAVPPEVGRAVVNAIELPVIGCGAGPHCHGHVIVTHDGVGLGPKHRPRFVPSLGDLATPSRQLFEQYADAVQAGRYPAAEHQYEMQPGEAEKLSPAPQSAEASASASAKANATVNV